MYAHIVTAFILAGAGGLVDLDGHDDLRFGLAS